MIRSGWVAAILAITLTACNGGDSQAEKSLAKESRGPIEIYTVNYPLADFAERIGGDLVDVVFPAPAGVDPAFWSPDGDTIAAYQGADLILLNGATYAKWVGQATLPATKVVDTSSAFADRLIELAGAITHSHGPGGEHEHGGWAFTTWLDPTLAIEQARAIADALASLRPDQSDEIRARFSRLESELIALDDRFSAAAGRIGDTPLVFSHPVYQYLVRRYGLNAVQVHWEPDEAPGPEAWAGLEATLQSHPARWMVWEGEPLTETVERLEGLGLASLVFDPCANRPEEGDYFTVMANNASALEMVSR